MTELTDGVVVLRSRRDRSGEHLFTVGHESTDVGSVCLTELPDGRGLLTWELAPDFTGHGYATRAVRLLIDYAFRAARLERVEALVDTANERAMRVATRPGLRREGVLRGHDATAGGRKDRAPYAPLATDPPTTEAAGFRALLNSFLPRKRAIAQMLVRDGDDRVLLCRLTYKNDFDLP